MNVAWIRTRSADVLQANLQIALVATAVVGELRDDDDRLRAQVHFQPRELREFLRRADLSARGVREPPSRDRQQRRPERSAEDRRKLPVEASLALPGRVVADEPEPGDNNNDQ
jgi:hypothetical protein